jgi:hypothetical protein
MKHLLWLIFLLFLLTLLSSCKSEAKVPIPFGVSPTFVDRQAPDDAIIMSNGCVYRANIHEAGRKNPWPPVAVTSTNFTRGSEIIMVRYRSVIEAKPTELHPNIVSISKEDGFWTNKLDFYTVGVPKGINITRGYGVGGGPPGVIGTVLAIIVEPDVAPGQYTFKIGIIIDDKDYGNIPCTVNVSGWDNS